MSQLLGAFRYSWGFLTWGRGLRLRVPDSRNTRLILSGWVRANYCSSRWPELLGHRVGIFRSGAGVHHLVDAQLEQDESIEHRVAGHLHDGLACGRVVHCRAMTFDE